MARTYANVWHRQVEGLDPGATGELELDADRESELVRLGRLEIQAQEYEVVGPRVVLDTAPGMTVSCALSQSQEAVLVGAGHLARVESKSKPRLADRGE